MGKISKMFLDKAKKEREKMETTEKTEPRELATIQEEYKALVGMVGEKTYYKRVIEAEIEGLHSRINQVNVEANERMKLTKEKKDETETPTATH